jgi:hypothetical protein
VVGDGIVTVATIEYCVLVHSVEVTVLPVQSCGTQGGTCVTDVVMQEGQGTS